MNINSFQSTQMFKLSVGNIYNFQPESDGSRSGSSLSLKNIAGQPQATSQSTAQSPSHRGVHRSISATHTKPNRRSSSGGNCFHRSDVSYPFD